VQLESVGSTSAAAKKAAETPGTAALCSHIAARMYQLPMLLHNLENSNHNRTRFLVLSHRFSNQPSGNDKTSLLVRLPDRPGGLASFIQEFEQRKINLSKLESWPARIADQFKYVFLIDFDGHQNDENFQEIYRQHTEQITVLGSYVKLC
jgi:chorismate mutase/prephenate dehydratase